MGKSSLVSWSLNQIFLIISDSTSFLPSKDPIFIKSAASLILHSRVEFVLALKLTMWCFATMLQPDTNL